MILESAAPTARSGIIAGHNSKPAMQDNGPPPNRWWRAVVETDGAPALKER